MEIKEESTILQTQLEELDTNDLGSLWKAALGEIELKISKPNFVTWFKNSDLIEKRENTALVSLPNNFAKEWIENKYSKIVLGALRALDEGLVKVRFTVCSSKNGVAIKSRVVEPAVIKEPTQMPFPEFRICPETNLNPKYTFDSFIVGKPNELPFAAASAVVEEIGTKYNPLFVYGGVGLGKTHLLQAIGNEIKNQYKGKVKVRYVSSEKFTNDVIWAIRNKRMETVKEKYRFVDVLIVDDIQFVIGKAATEEEFFHTFNALYESNKQIIISSDKPPKFMPDLEERLRSRFEGGMIADISLPDYELRFSILKSKAQEKGIVLSDEVLGLIATKVQKNFREIEGALNRILFFQKTKCANITPEVVEEILLELVQEPIRNISPNTIIQSVAAAFEISIEDLGSQSRKRELVGPRQITMYLLREMLGLSYPNIGDRLGKRDHTTALYAYEKISQEITRDQSLNQRILGIKELINRE